MLKYSKNLKFCMLVPSTHSTIDVTLADVGIIRDELVVEFVVVVVIVQGTTKKGSLTSL